MNQGNKRAKHLTFEAAYGQLEEAVHKLEQGGLSLEESTKLFEQGVELARICTEMLNAAEVRITRLQEDLSEHVETSGEEKYQGAQD